jgi:uncharacterized NAD(P)/FAD-binding protein YdhS
MNPLSTTIGVIGGGSVAVSWLHHFVEALAGKRGNAPWDLRVLVFEPRDAVGGGSAYQSDLESNLLNISVGAMSVAGDDRAHFKRWLQRHDIAMFRDRPIEDESYVSRPLFGRYLESVYATTVEAARACGITVEHVQRAVHALRRHRDGHCSVVTSDGESYAVRHVVLSIGNLDPVSFGELHGVPGYFASPYPTTRLCASVPADAAVCVLGTSLSAIDAILALASQGHRGPIVAVSRNGRLPSVRGTLNAPLRLRPELTAWLRRCKDEGRTLALETMIELLASELRACLGEHGEDIGAIVRHIPSASTFLDREIGLALSTPRQWQAFANASNEVVDLLWHLLSPSDRHRFNRELKTVWMARRVSFPLDNALALRGLMRSGQLRVMAGFRSARRDRLSTRFEIELEADGERRETLHATHLVNATSFSCDAARSDMPLLRALIADGMAVADRFGGLRVDFDSGCLIGRQGTVDPDITVLGSMAAGTYFWTNSMDINARLALGQACRLAMRLVRPQHAQADLAPAEDQ